METGKRILVVDDHPIMLEAVEKRLQDHGYVIVGKETTGAGALRFLSEDTADVALVDLAIPDMSGIELLKRIRERYPGTNVIAVVAPGGEANVQAALDAGAAACIAESATFDDLVMAIRQAFSRSVFFQDELQAAEEPHRRADDFGLTKRELEILRLMAEGTTNAEMARLLWVTEQTIKFHLSNVFRKLGVSNRTEASRVAYLQGLLSNEQQGAA